MGRVERTAGAWLAGAAATVGVASCSLVTDLSGLSSGGEDDAAASDATRDASGDASPDVGSDATADALAPDAGDGGAGEGGCIGMRVSFCDDFGRTNLRGAWDVAAVANGGAIFIEGDPGARHLRATTTDMDAGPEPVAALEKAFAGSASHFVVEAKLSLDAEPKLAGEYRILWMVSVSVPGGSFQLYYIAANAGGGTQFAAQDFTVGLPRLDSRVIPVSAGTVHRVRVEVFVGGRTTVSVNGVAALDYATPAYMLPGVPKLRLGVVSSPFPSSAFGMTADDLVFGAE